MKNRVILPIVLSLATLAPADSPPGIVQTQGRISVNGSNYGSPAPQTGHFKVALLDAGATETYWTNDGTNTGTPGGEPVSAVPVTVTDGHYSMGLGDTILANMAEAVPAALFENNAEIHLRTWFATNPAGPFERLSPDRRITSNGYAFFAATAGGVTAGTIDSTAIADEAVTTPKIADDAITPAKVKTVFAASEWSNSAATSLVWDGSVFTASVAFDEAFMSTPDIMAEGWTVQGSDAAGFIATRPGAGEFTISTVDASPLTGLDNDLAVVDGRPAVSYYDSTSKKLKFAIAADTEGTAWPAGNVVTIGDTGDFGLRSSLAFLDRPSTTDDRPAIAYFNETDGTVNYAVASDTVGTNWPAGNVSTIATTGSTTHLSLAVVNGFPAVVYWDSRTRDLHYAIAADELGGSWPAASQRIIDSDIELFGTPSLTVVDGRPAVAYYDAVESLALGYIIAADATGSSWPSGNISSVHSGIEINGDVSLAVVDGRPAIAYPLPNPGDLGFVIAADAAGLSWPPGNRVTVDSGIGLAFHSSLAVVNGRPAIAYEANSGLRYATASDAAGMSWPSANNLLVDAGTTSLSLALVEGLPGIGYRANGAVMKFARLTAPRGGWSAEDPAGATFAVRAQGVVDGAIGSAGLQGGAVTAEVIADGAVNADKLAPGAADDADADAMNEIQDLALSGDTLSISGGASADLGQYLRSDETDTFTGDALRIFGGSLAVGLFDNLDDIIYLNGFVESLRWEDAFNRLAWSDDLMISGALQTGQSSGMGVPYNRLGTNTATGGSIDDASDLLVSGSLEVDGTALIESGLINEGQSLFHGDVLLNPDSVNFGGPEAELHVLSSGDPTVILEGAPGTFAGGRFILRNGNGDGFEITNDNNVIAKGLRIFSRVGGVANSTAFFISNRGDGTRGHVGIGTQTPSAWLEVSSAGSTPQLLLHQDTPSDFARMSLTTVGGGEWTVSAEDSATGDLRFYNGSANRMILEDNGDLNVAGLLHAGRFDGAGYHTLANIDPTPDSGDMTNANDLYVGGDVEVEQTVYAGDNVVIGEAEGDHELYFYEDASFVGESLAWNNADDRFVFSDSLSLNGTLAAGNGASALGDFNYNFFDNETPTPDSNDISTSDDVYIGRDLEVEQTVYAATFTVLSDRNSKTEFVPVDTRKVLEKVAALPITSWRFKEEHEDREARHIGPMAQDFHAAFRLGADDRRISTVDADGVALAAIQALKAENDALKRQNAAILERLEALEKGLSRTANGD